MTISGEGFLPSTTLTVTFESTPVVIGVVQADGSGRFTADVRVPVDATPGVHTIRATGMGADGRMQGPSALVTVRGEVAGATSPPPGVGGAAAGPATARGGAAASPPPARRGAVAFTGADIALIAGAALFLVAGGAVILAAAGRRGAREENAGTWPPSDRV